MRFVFPSIAVVLVLAAGRAARCETPAATPMPPGLEMLRRFERGFAKATSEIGVRNGFLMFFADDAIAPPDTGRACDALRARPAPLEPRAWDLAWEPLRGDISQAGDLGWLTGPSSFTDGGGTKHTGTYFSIWRRDAAGLWTVVLDAGVDMPSPVPEYADGVFRPAEPTTWKPAGASPDASAQRDELMRVETEYLAAAGKGVAQAAAPVLSETARMHREGMHPLLGRSRILAELELHPATLRGRIRKVDVASSGDLGWVFGTCTLATAGAQQHAAFTHVWKRDAGGRWRLAVDVLNPPRE